MNALASPLMTPDEFLLWCLDQDERYELVDGVPVEMMAGASNRHDLIVINAIGELRSQLRGTPCRPATADIAVGTKRRSFRRPDVSVTCDPPSPDTYDAKLARMLIEVLSPSNTGVAWQRKLDEYRQREGLDYILLIESEGIAARLYHRTAGGVWDTTDYDDLEAVIDLPAIGCKLLMSELYRDVEFT